MDKNRFELDRKSQLIKGLAQLTANNQLIIVIYLFN